MTFAVIFDMDGVLIDNFHIHLEAWKIFCDKYKINLTEETLKGYAFGRTNDELFPVFFNNPAMTKEEINKLADEKELIYRDVYKGRVKLVDGLFDFLELLKANNIPIAVGTAGPRANVDFITSETGTTHFFNKIIDASFVKNGKPNPEVYLLAAKHLNFDPKNCIVFEDSFVGIEAGRGAGSHVIGVATTHPKEKLLNCNLVIENYNGLTISTLKNIMSK